MIKAFFVCGAKAISDLKTDKDEFNLLTTNNIVVMSYEQIIERAKRMLEVMFKEDAEV